jgi:hypothetical protein
MPLPSPASGRRQRFTSSARFAGRRQEPNRSSTEGEGPAC